MAFGSPQWMYKSGEAYELEQSLKFNDGDSAYLSWTPASAGNKRTYTWSGWVKRGELGSQNTLFGAGNGGSIFDEICFSSDDKLDFYTYQSATQGQRKSTAKFRDTSAWYHIVAVYDSTDSTALNRMKLYVNGEQITDLATTTNPSQNHEGNINNNIIHAVGAVYAGQLYNPYDGYMAEVNFIDGAAKTPADFGETGDYGEWKPIEYSGSYGTNGFYLPFKADYTVEGFSTVTYTGNSVDNNYIGGTGFKPDFTWIKDRNNNGSHALFDSVRGATKLLASNSTAVEDTAASYLKTFETDGFTLGTDSGVNYAARTYVAWNWDMSNPASNVGSTGIQFDNSDDDIVFELGTALGTGSFTVEYWTYFDSLQNYDTIFSTTRGTTGFNSGTDANGMAVWYSVGDDRILESASGTYATGQWYHTAYVRNGTTLKVYVNGVEKDSATDNNDYSEQTASVGALDGASEFSGIILDSLRVSNVARYTSNNFETPQARFTSDSNTLFLLNAPSESSTTLTDSSSNSLSLTITGTSVVSPSGSKPAFTNTDGSITSTGRANPTYGQSIVSYSGTGANATVGHGLSSAPEMVMVKERGDDTGNWYVWHTGFANTHAMYLNSNSGIAESDTYWNDTSPTSSVFNLGTNTDINGTTGTDTYIAYCFHSVTGYSKFGSYTGNANTSSGKAVTTGFEPAFLMIKKYDGTGSWAMFDNVRDSFNPHRKRLNADETATEASFSYGVNFNSTGFTVMDDSGGINGNGSNYIYAAFADKREYAYWLDQSGNNNDWTSNNLTESDISVDSPTNNFATLNPLTKRPAANGILSEGNLSFKSQTGDSTVFATMGILPDQKIYFEVYLQANSNQNFIGISPDYDNGDGDFDKVGVAYGRKVRGGATVQQYYNGGGDSSGTNLGDSNQAVGTVVGVAVDNENGQIHYAFNNSWDSDATDNNPAADVTGFDTTVTQFPKISLDTPDNTAWNYLNFGQDSSFAGNKASQGNQDGNEIGDFYYTPPTGYLALCTKNLPDVDVTPSEHFNTKLYVGNDSNKNASGIGFQPDFTWIKMRSANMDHMLMDAVRGATKNLYSNGPDAEGSIGLTSFNTDGFTTQSNVKVSTSGGNYVAWNWKANGSGSANTNGSINSTVSANVDAGFSVVSYTVSGESAYTTGHGLSKAPELILWKSRDRSSSWTVYAEPIGNAKKLSLDTTAAEANTGGWSSTSPTSTLVSHGGYYDGDKIIYYAFHSVDGYSKVDSYRGNGSTDGIFIYTGFKPMFVMTKVITDSHHWTIYNTDKAAYNHDATTAVYANTNSAEGTGAAGTRRIDLLSNGFKLRHNSYDGNANNQDYIYIAFAETPFKYSNAR